MKAVAKLKDEARKSEQAEQWEQAIEAYDEVLRLTDSAEAELPLYNRVGDLYVRMSRPMEAVVYYEKAADSYATAGLYNNAIALCNKALRYVPDRLDLLRKLGQFSAAQGLIADARRWYLDYAERQFESGDLDDAFATLEEFATTYEDAEIRHILGGKLYAHHRIEPAISALKRAHELYIQAGDRPSALAVEDELREIAPDALVGLASAAQAEPPAEPHEEPPEAPFLRLPGLPWDIRLEQVTLAPAPPPAPVVEPIDEPELTSTPRSAVEPAPVLDATGPVAEPAAESIPPLPPGQLNDGGLVEPQAPRTPLDPVSVGSDLGAEQTAPPAMPPSDDDLPSRPAPEDSEPAPPDVAFEGRTPVPVDPLPAPSFAPGKRAAALARPGAPGGATPEEELERISAAIDAGDTRDASAQLESLRVRFATEGKYAEALRVCELVLRMRSNDPLTLQQRAEYATALGEPDLMLSAYLELARVLAATGAHARAARFYELALDIDPQNDEARSVIHPVPPSAPPSGYFDLLELVTEEEAEATSTPLLLEEQAADSDEDRVFAEVLSQYRQKVSQRLSQDDSTAHYDLGLAYKRMGMINEAIAEFQTAIKGGAERLKVFEELGQCFLLNQQYGVAVNVLKRALQMPAQDERELVGVYYVLGRAYEELGRAADARAAYERVTVLDINFRDVSQRMANL